MTLRGHVKNGAIVLDEPRELPEGAAVQVELGELTAPDAGEPASLYERLKSVIGKAEGLPPDASINLDHYLYGHPKK